MTPPPSKEWMEMGVHPELCVGTVTRALSKVSNAVQKELESLKTEGQSYLRSGLELDFRVGVSHSCQKDKSHNFCFFPHSKNVQGQLET